MSDETMSDDDHDFVRAIEESQRQYEIESSNREASLSRIYNETYFSEEYLNDLQLQQVIQSSLPVHSTQSQNYSREILSQNIEAQPRENEINDYELQQAIRASLDISSSGNDEQATLRQRNSKREKNLANRGQQNIIPEDVSIPNYRNFDDQLEEFNHTMAPPREFFARPNEEEFQIYGNQDTEMGSRIENHGYGLDKYQNSNQNRQTFNPEFLGGMHTSNESSQQQDQLLDVMIQEEQYKKYIPYLDDAEKYTIKYWSDLPTHSKHQIIEKLKKIQKRQADQDRNLRRQQSFELNEELEKFKLNKEKEKKKKRKKHEQNEAKKKKQNRRLEHERIIKQRKVERKKRLEEIKQEIKLIRRDKNLTRDEKQIRLDKLKDEERQIRFIETL